MLLYGKKVRSDFDYYHRGPAIFPPVPSEMYETISTEDIGLPEGPITNPGEALLNSGQQSRPSSCGEMTPIIFALAVVGQGQVLVRGGRRGGRWRSSAHVMFMRNISQRHLEHGIAQNSIASCTRPSLTTRIEQIPQTEARQYSPQHDRYIAHKILLVRSSFVVPSAFFTALSRCHR